MSRVLDGEAVVAAPVVDDDSAEEMNDDLSGRTGMARVRDEGERELVDELVVLVVETAVPGGLRSLSMSKESTNQLGIAVKSCVPPFAPADSLMGSMGVWSGREDEEDELALPVYKEGKTGGPKPGPELDEDEFECEC